MNRKRSLVDVQRHVRLHAPFFGRRRMAAITTADVRRYVAPRQGEGAKSATINRELAVLSRAFTLAIAAGALLSRPHIALLREDHVGRGFFEAARRRGRDKRRSEVAMVSLTPWSLRAMVIGGGTRKWRDPWRRQRSARASASTSSRMSDAACDWQRRNVISRCVSTCSKRSKSGSEKISATTARRC